MATTVGLDNRNVNSVWYVNGTGLQVPQVAAKAPATAI
jgi:hypothetical protein